MITTQIGQRLKSLRTSKGLTQKSIAEKLFIDERTYSKFERGEKKTIDIIFLNQIAAILQTDLIALIKPEAVHLEETYKKEAVSLDLLAHIKQFQAEIVGEIKALEQRIDIILEKSDV